MNALTQLTLRNFRCFSSKSLELHPGFNFFIGPNAQGKTSLLEAACILLRLKSPRTHGLGEAIRFQEEAFLLEGDYAGKKLSMRFAPRQPIKRLLHIDDVPQHEVAEYLNIGCVVWFGSDDREIIDGPGERRRRFLDSAGLQIHNDYRHHLKSYDRALRSRNMLLRRQRPRREIEAYDAVLAEHGDLLMSLRASLSVALATESAKACKLISEETMCLQYKPGKPTATTSMREALEYSRTKEMQLAMTLVGPHRDEILLTLNDIPTATFGSEGQRRTVALALKLGLTNLLTLEKSIPPLLLLDDVFGDLDRSRCQALLASIPQGAQALFTTTELKRHETPSNAHFFELMKA